MSYSRRRNFGIIFLYVLLLSQETVRKNALNCSDSPFTETYKPNGQTDLLKVPRTRRGLIKDAVRNSSWLNECNVPASCHVSKLTDKHDLISRISACFMLLREMGPSCSRPNPRHLSSGVPWFVMTDKVIAVLAIKLSSFVWKRQFLTAEGWKIKHDFAIKQSWIIEIIFSEKSYEHWVSN